MAGITSLAGAVAYLYRRTELSFDKLILKIEECERDREELWRKLAEKPGANCDNPPRDQHSSLEESRHHSGHGIATSKDIADARHAWGN